MPIHVPGFVLAVLLVQVISCAPEPPDEPEWTTRIVPPVTTPDEDAYVEDLAAEVAQDPHHVHHLRQFIDAHAHDEWTIFYAFRLLSMLAHENARPEYLDLAIHADRTTPDSHGDMLIDVALAFDIAEVAELLSDIATDAERQEYVRTGAFNALGTIGEPGTLCEMPWKELYAEHESSPLTTLFILRANLACCPSGISPSECSAILRKAKAHEDFNLERYDWLIEELEAGCEEKASA